MEVAASLNQFIIDVEKKNKVLYISHQFHGLKYDLVVPYRRFIREGMMKKITSALVKTCFLFLFNDVIIYSHRKLITSYKYKGAIEINTAWVRELDDTPKAKNLFQLVSQKKTYTFMVDTPEKKLEWINDLNHCINDLVKNKPQLVAQRSEVRVKESSLNIFGISPKRI